MNHHDTLITQACQDGWVRGFGWRKPLMEIVKYNPLLAGEWPELAESIACAETPRPDAWRIVIEDQNTPDTFWSYPVLVLEFLEVEVTSGVTQDKDELYRYLWDVFDATHYYHLRIWHMDRFGVVRPYITNSTSAPMISGMNAGWRV